MKDFHVNLFLEVDYMKEKGGGILVTENDYNLCCSFLVEDGESRKLRRKCYNHWRGGDWVEI